MQKQKYFLGFLQKAYENSNIYKVFCTKRTTTAIFSMFSERHVRKQQYLQGVKICVAQNVGKVWVSFEAIFLKSKNAQKKAFFCLFSLFGQGALLTRFGVICWCHLTKHVSLVTIPA